MLIRGTKLMRRYLRYLPGEGILPHTDGPAYEPLVSNLSLGSHIILTLTPSPSFYKGVESLSPLTASLTLLPPSTSSASETAVAPEVPPDISIFLPPRSLLVLSSILYSTFLHTIEARKMDTMDELKACVNWNEYWASVLEDGKTGEDGEPRGKEESEESKREHEASRRLVEAGKGWERGRRVSMTCRRVAKVRMGIKLG